MNHNYTERTMVAAYKVGLVLEMDEEPIRLAQKVQRHLVMALKKGRLDQTLGDIIEEAVRAEIGDGEISYGLS
jgi:hypothetical protein